MPLQVGMNVLEVDGLASPTLVAAPTSVAGFVGVTRRGVPHRAVRVSAPDQAVARTGSARPDAYLATAVAGFFANGGREAYLVRVVGPGSVPASRTLTDRETVPAPCLRVRAGYRGEADPGDWGEGLRLDVRDDPAASTTLDGALAVGATAAVLASVAGIAVGSVLRVPTAPAAFRAVTGLDPVARQVSWAGALAAAAANGAPVTTAEFRLVVRWRDEASGTFVVVEDWPGLSMQPGSTGYVVDRLDHPLTGSRHVLVEDLDGGLHPGENLPVVGSGLTLDNGSETLPGVADLSGDPATRTGLHALDTVAVQLLAVPDAHRLVADGPAQVARAATDWCAARGDCLYVGSPPDRAAPAGVVPRSAADYTETVSAYAGRVTAYAAGLQAGKVYGALYAPWVVVAEPGGAGPAPVRVVPPDGHVMGVYARTEAERGVAKAPAGDAAVLRGAQSLVAGFTQAQHTDLVRVGLTNGILATPGKGLVVSASRTLSSDTRWTYVNVRLLFNFVKATLRDGLKFVRQEPHTEALRRSVAANVVTPFLLGLWRQGAFGSDPPEHVFTVKCDAENNPPSQVDLGYFQIEVYFYAARPAETVRVVVGQQPGGGTAAES